MAVGASRPAPATAPAAPPESPPVGGEWPPVSVFMCVRNEERHLATAVRAVLDQDYPGPIEVVVAVGPSSDRTAAVAADLADADARVTVVANPSGRTPDGLNIAVARTRHPVLARVDGHAILPAGYLREAVRTLLDTGAVNVGGVMAAEGRTPFEQAVARAMTSWIGVGGARFHRGGEAGPVDTVYLGVFRREVIVGLGGYDERFTRAQDYELNIRLRAAGGIVWFDPRLRVTYRPRATVRALAEQYANYGRWRWMVTAQHPRSVRGRYLAPPAALLACVGGVVAAGAGARIGLVIPAGYLVAVTVGAATIGRSLPAAALARLPGVLVVMHMSWGAGFLTSALRGRRLGPTPITPVRAEPAAEVG